MRFWGSRRSICALLATTSVAAVALVSAGAGSAARTVVAPVPTSVTMFTGDTGAGTFTAFVAVQKLSAGTAGITGIITGLPPGKADLALVPNSACGSPRGHEQLRVNIPHGRAFDLRGPVSGTIGSTTAIAVFFSDYKLFVCLKAKPFIRTGAVVVLKSGGAAIGVVSFQRNTWPMDVLGMATTPPAVANAMRVGSAPCSATQTPANLVVFRPLYRIQKFFYGDVLKTEFAKFDPAKSVRVTFGAGGTGTAVGCAKFELADLDALKG